MFNFEKNLPHQEKAVKSTASVFDSLEIKKPTGAKWQCINPVINQYDANYFNNIRKIQTENGIDTGASRDSNIIDVMMETGTGKTYTYTKTIFELNKLYGIFKFVVVVPTLPIKAGTIDFLKSDSSREHFKEQYGKTIQLHIVESKNGSKNKKNLMPPAIYSFVNSGNFEKNKIQVLIINAGMINSKTMQETFDKSLFDNYFQPFQALSATKPFMIIDEPHKFDTKNKTWDNIQKINPQYIIRYGATFPEKEVKQKDGLGRTEKIKVKDYHNLIYTLSAVDAFNQNLVKGVIGHITEFETGKNAVVKFTNSDGKEASFSLEENGTKKTVKITKNESLEKIHPAMQDLLIEKLNKTTALLSNGLELKTGDKINPYSYTQTLQETMIQKAVKSHFEIEKKYLTEDVKIKPLSLFFIDNIQEYRNSDGYIKKTVEKYIKAEAKKLLATETNSFYKNYLQKTLEDISKTHGGYFAVDKKETDEVIEKEISEILHDKEAILSLDNPRRFVFSKWTLREGWDNPNIFQICKLRSSGSEISKLQEVGRGLRLPVNQYGNRVKTGEFYLNYFVDFTENDFVDKLVNEINQKSGAISREEIPSKLSQKYIKQITEKYNLDEEDLLQKLDDLNLIKRNNDFKEGGFEYIKLNYPLIFEGVDSNKIRKANQQKKKLRVRTEKYNQLKDLWEKLNQKVVLEYKIENENKFKEIFIDFLKDIELASSEIREKTAKVKIEKHKAFIVEEIHAEQSQTNSVTTIKYSDFLKQLSFALKINLKTIHQSFIEAGVKIDKYLNQTTLRRLKQNFESYLMHKAINKFEIGYQQVASSIHPTALTNKSGEVKKEVDANNVGVFYTEEKVPDNYIFDTLFYDSELEKENIKSNISEVVVFTKIPKNSIKIPVAGGKSYSPDFAYILNYKNGKQKLNFIVETKNADKEGLRSEEKQKIKHAEKFFGNNISIKFEKQFSTQKIQRLIEEVLGGYSTYSHKKHIPNPR